ncbi:MAG TPA: hypothetical protein VGM84_01570 [Steroidobacteraceae bacterium]
MTGATVVDSRQTRLQLGSNTPRLMLVTCYPFDAVVPGGPLRYVIVAQLLPDAPDQPVARD